MNVVEALPESSQKDFACVCCPNSPGLSLVCMVMPCLIPHLAVCGGFFAIRKIVQLRRLIQPVGAEEESYLEVCLSADMFLLQMSNEVEERKAAGVPVLRTAPRALFMERS